MEHRIIKMIKQIIPILIVMFAVQSCYYDNVEELYPNPPDCDTINVSYADDVWPIISTNCTSCHSGGAPSGNVYLDNYDNIVKAAENGSLLGTIRHESGWSPMPKGGTKLSDCNIAIIEKWVDDSTPNN